MANKDPSKTEQPTPKVINDARREGNVLTSTELNSFVIVLGATLLLFLTLRSVHDGFNNIYHLVLDIDCRQPWDISQIKHGTLIGGRMLIEILTPILVAICILAIVVTRAQTGHYFEFEPLAWNLKGLNPVNGLKRVVPSVDNTVKLILVICKIAIIAVFVVFSVKNDLQQMLQLPIRPFETGVIWAIKKAFILTLQIVLCFGLVAILDYVWNRKKYFENLMMTKQEVKDERKNAEGDPIVKGKIRQKMRELTMMRMIVEVPKADVIVTNPIHVAVALKYERGDHAPMVVAKGLRKRAQRIKEIANEAGVPIIEEPVLARSIYRSTKLGSFIHEEFFGAVAAILARLQQAGGKDYAKRAQS